MRHLLNVVRGFLMGSADVVPGVSGGTVALVLGIYERLVAAIRSGAAALGSAARGRWAGFRGHLEAVDWGFLIPLLAGIILAIFSLAALIERMLEDEPQNTAALFFGLVVGAIAIAWKLVDAWSTRRLVASAAVAALVFVLVGLQSDEVVDPGALLFLGAGAIAIIAMILPGISGSLILLILGMYEAVVAAVNDRRIAMLLIFIGGAVVGLALFSTLLNRLLRDHHATTMALLVGLMVGSLRRLWPWPHGTDTATLSAPRDVTVPILLAIAGALVVVAIGRLVGRSTDGGVAVRSD